MGLLKIFTRRSSKAKLKGHDTQSHVEIPSQEPQHALQHEPDVPATSSQQQPDLSPKAPDPLDQSETWDSASAPAPFVPRHPSLVVEERPRTAASIRSLSRDWSQFPTRPKREPRRPPVSFKKPSPLASISNAYENTAQAGEHETDINSLLRLRRTNVSRSSLGSIKSKDILDAQEEIRPTDFRSRVQATGARDYGEDVADRNITRHRDGTLSPTPDPRQMSNRTKSLSSSSIFPRVTDPRDFQALGPPLTEVSSPEPVELHSFSSRNKRRLSLNTYVPTGMVSPHAPISVTTSPNLMDDVASKDFAPPAENPGTETVARPKDLSPTTNNFSRPRSPRNLQIATTQGNIAPSHRDHAFDGKIAEVLASGNSAESFITASNGQHGSDWSPVTNRSKNFNIDDYVSSDDDSFTTETKRARSTAQGEEDLLFKPGYGITGAALPGLEALGEEDEYSTVSTKNNRNNSVSSDGSVAVASSPKDNRYGTHQDLSPALRHVRSDPEELYMSTFGRFSMRDRTRPSTANPWAANDEDTNAAVDLDESYTPSTSSIDSDDPRSDGDLRSTVGSLGGFRPQRSESSFSVYSIGGTVTTTITGGANAMERDTYDDVRAPRRGLKRLSALGTLYGRSMGSFGSADRRPATTSDGAARGEMKTADIIRRRKEDKTRKRSDLGLRSIREKRMTEAFGRPDNDGIARLREHLRDDEEMWELES
ncbi:hypothetical protein INS49_000101 [Diaporthe citri]|uniref:uncharacterized protein n=1 Tax=Diaporthe citri TaxID=83186 RepID=UPI001C8031E0|nr:uncharacterized protein INS49_000101 [Diaporthe citri]KAG6365925.1 hypothetical protein INS49_000101 [Diaporthe citri]